MDHLELIETDFVLDYQKLKMVGSLLIIAGQAAISVAEALSETDEATRGPRHHQRQLMEEGYY